jgi:hypothetical protein
MADNELAILAKRAERRIKRRILGKWKEARRRGMTNESEIAAWAIEQLEKTDPLICFDIAIASCVFPEEADDDERMREARAWGQHIAHLVIGGLDQ